MHKLIKKARDFASEAHYGQLYGDDLPYTHHLYMVDRELTKAGVRSSVLRSAAWLHDVIEDTPVTQAEVRREFGAEIADIVQRLTNPLGGNRAWRHSQSYPKIADHPGATTVKLADRCANIIHGVRTKSSLVSMYIREHDKFLDAMLPMSSWQLSPDTDSYSKSKYRFHGSVQKLRYRLVIEIMSSPIIFGWHILDNGPAVDTSEFLLSGHDRKSIGDRK